MRQARTTPRKIAVVRVFRHVPVHYLSMCKTLFLSSCTQLLRAKKAHLLKEGTGNQKVEPQGYRIKDPPQTPTRQSHKNFQTETMLQRKEILTPTTENKSL